MMAEYTDRDALRKKLKETAKQYTALKKLETAQDYWWATTVIDSEPAADVAPVVHGQWGDNGIPGSMLRGCSVCGFTCGASSFFYCPSCGARMDGENEKKPARENGQAE